MTAPILAGAESPVPQYHSDAVDGTGAHREIIGRSISQKGKVAIAGFRSPALMTALIAPDDLVILGNRRRTGHSCAVDINVSCHGDLPGRCRWYQRYWYGEAAVTEIVDDRDQQVMTRLQRSEADQSEYSGEAFYDTEGSTV